MCVPQCCGMAARKSMHEEQEEIELKPPIELIPDEYEHFTDQGKIHVHIFSVSHEDAQSKVKSFKDNLGDSDFKLIEHSLEKDNCVDILNGSK